eukprot:scaffold7006_cov174-Skeletonema_marinoi.AAC.40
MRGEIGEGKRARRSCFSAKKRRLTHIILMARGWERLSPTLTEALLKDNKRPRTFGSTKMEATVRTSQTWNIR